MGNGSFGTPFYGDNFIGKGGGVNRAAEQQGSSKDLKNYCATELLHYCSEVAVKKQRANPVFNGTNTEPN